MYESKIRQFQKEDELSFPASNINLFVGSSTIRRWDTLQTDMFPKPVLNRGFGGSDMKSLLLLYDKLIRPYQFSKIFIYEGDNDLNSKKRTPESVFKLFTLIVAKIKTQCPDAKILYISIKCSPARLAFKEKYDAANNLFREYCDTESNLKYIDIASHMRDVDGMPIDDLFNKKDRIHPSRAGYKLMTAIIKPYLYPTVSE